MASRPPGRDVVSGTKSYEVARVGWRSLPHRSLVLARDVIELEFVASVGAAEDHRVVPCVSTERREMGVQQHGHTATVASQYLGCRGWCDFVIIGPRLGSYLRRPPWCIPCRRTPLHGQTPLQRCSLHDFEASISNWKLEYGTCLDNYRTIIEAMDPQTTLNTPNQTKDLMRSWRLARAFASSLSMEEDIERAGLTTLIADLREMRSLVYSEMLAVYINTSEPEVREYYHSVGLGERLLSDAREILRDEGERRRLEGVETDRKERLERPEVTLLDAVSLPVSEILGGGFEFSEGRPTLDLEVVG